jgi:hypothetical protein
MESKKKKTFDSKTFLSKMDGGRTISEYRKDQIVYQQGEPADFVFYIQAGKIKITVTSKQGKEAVVAVLGPNQFVGEGCETVETVDRENPLHVPCETRARAFGWDPISGLHQGQRPQRPHSKAVYMAAPDPVR